MESKVLIKRGGAYAFAPILILGPIFTGLTTEFQWIAIASFSLAAFFFVYSLFSYFTPHLIQENDVLLLRPRIPFESKKIPINTIAEFRQGWHYEILEIVLKDNTIHKVSLFSLSHEEQKNLTDYLRSLIKQNEPL